MAKEAVKVIEGAVIPYTAAAAIANGDVVAFTSHIGVAYGDAAIGDSISVAIEGVFEITAATADTVAVGDDLYFDTTGRNLTTVSTSMIPAGMAVTAKAGAAAGTVQVKLK